MSEAADEAQRRIGPTRAFRNILQEKGLDHWYSADEIREGFEKHHIYDDERMRVVHREIAKGHVEVSREGIRLRRADDSYQTPLYKLHKGRRRKKSKRTIIR